jgi:hypothetical protein
MEKDALSALRNLQLMCDTVVAWGASVKLSFNALKSVLIIFSSKRNLPPLSLLVDNVPAPRSNSILYQGLTIDDKLSRNLHTSKKCTVAKKLLFLILKYCQMSWGLSRNTISLLYKSTFTPTILYNCTVWVRPSTKSELLVPWNLRNALSP